MSKIKITIGLFLFFFLVFSAGQTFAEEDEDIVCTCILHNTNSKCSLEEARDTLCIDENFVNNIINQGKAFSLKDKDGKDLGLVKLEAAEFTVQGVKQLYFISLSSEGALISNPDLSMDLIVDELVDFGKADIYSREPVLGYPDNILYRPGLKKIMVFASKKIYGLDTNIYVDEYVFLQANDLIRYGKIVIGDHKPRLFKAGTVDITVEKGVVKGGDIFNQAGDYQIGTGGYVGIRAKIIEVGNIAAAGFGSDGGDVRIFGENITVGSIAVQSIVGWQHHESTGWKFYTGVFDRAGLITIQKNINDKRINFLDAKSLLLHGVVPRDIEIEAKERIWIRNWITTYSGCDLESVQEKCPYGNLCEKDPNKYPFRKYCADYNKSGKVNLYADGVGLNRGIRIGDSPFGGGIDNRANSDHIDSNLAGSGYTGAGIVGEIKLEAPKSVVYVGVFLPSYINPYPFSINAVGFHPDISDAVFIKGTWVQIKGDIITDNFNLHDFSGSAAGKGAGNIKIIGTPIDDSLKGLAKSLDTSSDIIFAKWKKNNIELAMDNIGKEDNNIVLASAEKAVETLTDANFDNFIKKYQIVLVDFGATWCGSCQAMKPILEEIASDPKYVKCNIKIGALDTDQNPIVKFKYKISDLPTFIFFKKGEQITFKDGTDRLIGPQSKETLTYVLDKLIESLPPPAPSSPPQPAPEPPQSSPPAPEPEPSEPPPKYSDSEECLNCLTIVKPFILLEGALYARGQHPNASNGGDIAITGAYRIEGSGKLKIDTSGKSLSNDYFNRYQEWYIYDGVSEDPSGNLIADTWNYCKDGTKEYYNGQGLYDPAKDTGASLGISGGNGGDIVVIAPIIQWQGGVLDLNADGGDGSRGGMGGEGDYCWNYTGPKNHVIPRTGRGGKGGKGGEGGAIRVFAKNPDGQAGLHCFRGFQLSSKGGNGGQSGGNNSGKLVSWLWTYNRNYTGNCDLIEWKNGLIPEEKTPEIAGDGGNAGTIVLDMATDIPVKTISAAFIGGYAGKTDITTGGLGEYEERRTMPYPWYCDSPKTGPELIQIEKAVDKCLAKAWVNRDQCIGHSRAGGGPFGCYIFYGPKQQNCKLDCEKRYDRAAAECEYTGNTDEDSPFMGGNGNFKDEIKGDPNCSGEWAGGYDWEQFNSTCRNKKLQVSCQNEAKGGFTLNETYSPYDTASGVNIDPNNNTLEVSQAKPGAYNGQIGANGGNGGIIIINSLLEDGVLMAGPRLVRGFDVSGGEGGDGGNGRKASVDKPGEGGKGGNGGNAGTIEVTNENLINQIISRKDNHFAGGQGGLGGLGGYNYMLPPAAYYFCSTSNWLRLPMYTPYWDYNLECNGEKKYCCPKDKLYSCRTKKQEAKDKIGGDEYSADAYMVYFEHSVAFLGPDGDNGQEGSASQISALQPSGPEKCQCTTEGGCDRSMELPEWKTHKFCFNEACINDLDGGENLCVNDQDCVSALSVCEQGPCPEHSCPDEVKAKCGSPPDYSQCTGKETSYGTDKPGIDNFNVTAHDTRGNPFGGACEIAFALEYYRCKSAVEWTGLPLGADEKHPDGQDWTQPCPVTATIGNIGAGGATHYLFDRGQVYGWRMEIQGTLDTILNSVIPHETLHMSVATEFRQPIPLWVNEGMASSMETNKDKCKLFKILINNLYSRPGRSFPFNQIINMMNYPPDMMPFYVQGWSMVEYLLCQGKGGCGAKRKLFDVIEKAMDERNSIASWTAVLKEHYGFKNLADFQKQWVDSVAKQLGPGNTTEERIKSGSNPCSCVPAEGKPSVKNKTSKDYHSNPNVLGQGQIALEWTYLNDDLNSNQSQYCLKVATGQNFNDDDLIADHCVSQEVSSGDRGSAGLIIDQSPTSDIDDLNIGFYGENNPLYWQIRVEDSQGNWSEWDADPEFITPKHDWPHPKFSWLPAGEEREFLFIDETKFCDFYDSVSDSYYCDFADPNNPGNREWHWDFDNDGVIDSPEQNPIHTFPENDKFYLVSLEVEDSDGYEAKKLIKVPVGNPIAIPPKWIEIPPF